MKWDYCYECYIKKLSEEHQEKLLISKNYSPKTKDSVMNLIRILLFIGIIVSALAGFIGICVDDKYDDFKMFCCMTALIGFPICFLGFKISMNLKTQVEKDYDTHVENNRILVLEQMRNISKSLKPKYNELLKQAHIPVNCMQVSITNDIGYYNFKGKYFIWREKDTLNLFPNIDLNIEDNISPTYICDSIHKNIQITDIEYYTTQGELYRETKISGGGGGGSSVGGAVIGGLIAGGAGAVIGSRKEINEVKSELITHDTRKTVINYYVDKDTIKSIFMTFDDFKVLQKIIPEKDYNIIYAIETDKILNSAVKTNDVISISEQIKELAKLKDEGILTEEEFTDKKKELLAKI